LDWKPILILFIVGLPIGSFLNVVIWRLPRRENVVFPPSHCPLCNSNIRPYDNIPVISYILLGGKCRYCGAKISLRYPVVELTTAILFAIAWPLTGSALSWNLVAAIIFTGIGVAITGIDIQHRIIPDELSMSGLVVGLILAPLRAGSLMSLLWAFAAALGGAILLYIIRVVGGVIFKKEAMGWGDIKLIAMIGAFVGLTNVPLVLFLASFLGMLGGFIAMASSKKAREERLIPFGPFLIAAGLLAFYFGNYLVDWYLSRILAS